MSPKRILIVEDDQFLREFYQELLAAEGFAVEIAEEGEKALMMIQKGGWSIVMLDIMLPKKDGLQILKDLQIKPPIIPIGPIVILTNLGNETIINQAFALGASGYLVKSAMNPDEIVKEINGFLAS